MCIHVLCCKLSASILSPPVIVYTCATPLDSQGDALRHSLLTLYLGASYNQGLAGPSPAIANASGHAPPVPAAPDKDSPDAKGGGGISLAIRNELSLVDTQVRALNVWAVEEHV